MSSTVPLPCAVEPEERSLNELVAAAADACERQRKTALATARIIADAAASLPGGHHLADVLRDLHVEMVASNSHAAELQDTIRRAVNMTLASGFGVILPPGPEVVPERDRPRPRSRRKTKEGPRNTHLKVAATGLAAAAAITVATVAKTPESDVSVPPRQASVKQHPDPATSASSERAVIPVNAPIIRRPEAGRGYRPRHARPAGEVPPPSPVPPPSRSPSPPPSSSSSPPPVSGQLVVQNPEVTVGPSGTAELVLFAQQGPVSWEAAADSGDVHLEPSSGTIQAGQSVIVTVTVDPAARLRPGTALVRIGGQETKLFWG